MSKIFSYGEIPPPKKPYDEYRDVYCDALTRIESVVGKKIEGIISPVCFVSTDERVIARRKPSIVWPTDLFPVVEDAEMLDIREKVHILPELIRLAFKPLLPEVFENVFDEAAFTQLQPNYMGRYTVYRNSLVVPTEVLLTGSSVDYPTVEGSEYVWQTPEYIRQAMDAMPGPEQTEEFLAARIQRLSADVLLEVMER